MKTKFSLFLMIIVSLTMFVSCGSVHKVQRATIKAPAYKTMTFNSYPEGARVYVNNKYIGITPLTKDIMLKYTNPLTKKNLTIEVKFIKEGYKSVTKYVEPSFNNFNITNNLYDYGVGIVTPTKIEFPDDVFVEMESAPSYVPMSNVDTTIPEGQDYEMVSRDNPGATSLEKTIIRWFFDSEPRGARIYWRIISSVPAQVKPTNELYLGTTPYEETRSFNILGLTYENSRDVQIEVKMTREGYMDMTKRFNVRAAIDQQEISSFFDMVKK